MAARESGGETRAERLYFAGGTSTGKWAWLTTGRRRWNRAALAVVRGIEPGDHPDPELACRLIRFWSSTTSHRFAAWFGTHSPAKGCG